MASSTDQINNNIITMSNKNNILTNKLNKLQNHNLAARGELKEKNYLYNELLTQNIVLLFIILGASGVFFLKNKK